MKGYPGLDAEVHKLLSFSSPSVAFRRLLDLELV